MEQDIVHAPFTPEQVASLVAYQRSGYCHDYTCGLCGRRLDVDTSGWLCQADGYRQYWAWRSSADGSWQRWAGPFGRGS